MRPRDPIGPVTNCHPALRSTDRAKTQALYWRLLRLLPGPLCVAPTPGLPSSDSGAFSLPLPPTPIASANVLFFSGLSSLLLIVQPDGPVLSDLVGLFLLPWLYPSHPTELWVLSLSGARLLGERKGWLEVGKRKGGEERGISVTGIGEEEGAGKESGEIHLNLEFPPHPPSSGW